jgi:hypothetical protein
MPKTRYRTAPMTGSMSVAMIHASAETGFFFWIIMIGRIKSEKE